MNKTSVAITAAFCVAIGFLIARFIGPTEAPPPAKVEKAVVAAPTPPNAILTLFRCDWSSDVCSSDLFCVAIGFLIARFIGPTEAPAPAKVEDRKSVV